MGEFETLVSGLAGSNLPRQVGDGGYSTASVFKIESVAMMGMPS
jgi:hypothetical protein